MFTTRFSLVLILIASVSGCSNFRDLKKDLSAIEQQFSSYAFDISLSETVAQQQASPLVLVSLSDASESGIEVYRLLGKAGRVQINDSSELVAFFIFKDTNQDLTFQDYEPFDWVAIDRSGDDSTIAINMNLRTAQEHPRPAPDYLLNQDFLLFQDIRGMGVNIGTVTPLDDQKFTLERAKKGMWQPLQFVLNGGAGLHFLEPYDADKTPVLFVHGLSGSPVNFIDMIAALDSSRYQAVVFSYPSGYGVEATANGLYYLTNTLQHKFKFNHLHVVSHSLGGLVSRAYINQCQREHKCDYLRSYTSLSAPWGGSAGAKRGADSAPVVMPVWKDLSPNSELLATLFDYDFPNDLPHLLMFSFRNDSRLGDGSGDGVVALSSQLRPEAQQQALGIRGYNESHAGILASPDSISDWLAFIDQH